MYYILLNILSIKKFNFVELFTSSAPVKPVAREEPEKIKKWREEQKKRLEEKGKCQHCDLYNRSVYSQIHYLFEILRNIFG